MKPGTGALILTAALALAGCGTTTATFPPPATTAAQPASSGNPAHHHHRHAHPLRHVHDPGQVTGTVTGPCHTRRGGQLPDRRCTPGAYDPALTAAILCDPDYSPNTGPHKYRPSTYATNKFKYHTVEPAYGMTNVAGELDHLIPLEMGGSNDASNLWVEPGSIPNPKDAVEGNLARWVCAATGTEAEKRLHAARIAIARNWMTADQNLGIIP